MKKGCLTNKKGVIIVLNSTKAKACIISGVTKISLLLDQIANLQSQGTSMYAKGLFPSQRLHLYFPYAREDDNTYFSAIIAFTLTKLSVYLDSDSQNKIADIAQKVTENYEDYRNKDDLSTYNFWKTIPSKHFPNGYVFSQFDFFRMADDVDDTALVYLTKEHSQDDLIWLKEKLTKHANLVKKKAFLVPKAYQGLKVYSTWFGKNMCIEFDACVLTNLLYLIFEKKLALNEYDHGTIAFLKQLVLADDHFTSPFHIAPYYPNTSIILYHLARLIAAFDIPGLIGLKQKIINDIRKCMLQTSIPMEQVILSSSLLRLGEKPRELDFLEGANEVDKFHWFTAGMQNTFNNPISKSIAKYDFFHFKHHCKAHNLTLLLEHEVLTKITS